MIELSTATRRHIATLFPLADAEEAADLLARECAENLPLIGRHATPESLERFRFAALRLSAGSLAGLRDAIALAKVDWRDLLVAAGFGHDVRAHEVWQPQLLDPGRLESWRAGRLLPGVKFRFHEGVELLSHPSRRKNGLVVDLVAVEPSPRYRVTLESGDTIEAYEVQLGRAG
jgi:hypothetical protein